MWEERPTGARCSQDGAYPQVDGLAVERGLLTDRDRPDLILLEMRLPIVDGEGFVAELRSRRIDVPIVAMAAGPSAVHWARKMKLEGAITKPLQVEELVVVIRKILSQP